MKRILNTNCRHRLIKLLFYAVTIFCSEHSSAQLTVSGGYTSQQLATMLMGSTGSVFNVQYTGDTVAIGSFNGVNSDIGIDSGVLITTGNIINAAGPNINGEFSYGQNDSLPGDSELDVLSGNPTYDAAILEFDFVPLSDTITFRYVFASEEYDEWVCSQFNDVFALFISGPGIAGSQNIAFVPGTNLPVSINSVNGGSVGADSMDFSSISCQLTNSQYFIDNEYPPGLTVQYNGFTTVISATQVVIPLDTFHIRLAIADGSDGWLDSGVFLEAEAGSGTPPVASFQSSNKTLCSDGCINFTDLSTNATSWQWSFAGALDSISTAQNPQNICYSTPGIYNVTLIASNAAGSDTAMFSNYITVNPSPPTPVITQVYDTLLYCDTYASYASYQWFFDSTLIMGATDSSIVISQSGNYNVQVTNENGCKTSAGINIILGIQNYAIDDIISIYPNPTTKTFTVYGLQFTVGRIEIYNVVGQVCGQSEIKNPILSNDGFRPNGGKSAISIDVSSLPSGIYFVQVDNESGRWVGKFMKE